jgi:hypothetical protein
MLLVISDGHIFRIQICRIVETYRLTKPSFRVSDQIMMNIINYFIMRKILVSVFTI